MPFAEEAGRPVEDVLTPIRWETPDEQSLEPFDAAFADRPVGDAYLCGNDMIAAAFIRWLERRGLRVPEDVAVVGFDNVSIGKHFRPAIATCEHPGEQIYAILEREMFAFRSGGAMTAAFQGAARILPVWRMSAGGGGWLAEGIPGGTGHSSATLRVVAGAIPEAEC